MEVSVESDDNQIQEELTRLCTNSFKIGERN